MKTILKSIGKMVTIRRSLVIVGYAQKVRGIHAFATSKLRSAKYLTEPQQALAKHLRSSTSELPILLLLTQVHTLQQLIQPQV